MFGTFASAGFLSSLSDDKLVILLIAVSLWVAVPVYLFFKGYKLSRLTQLMRCLPTSKTRAVFIGMAEVKGTSVQEVRITSYLAERDCVWYSYSIEEEWVKYETETYRDSHGRVRTRRVRKSGWTTIAAEESIAPFRLQDDTGDIRVLPEGAEVDGIRFLSRTCGTYNPLYYGKGPLVAIPHSSHRRRFNEVGVPVGVPLYVIGTTQLQEDAIHPEFSQADNGDPYLISMRDEARIVRFNLFLIYFYPLLASLILLAVCFLDYERYGNVAYCVYNPEHDFLHQHFGLYCALGYWLIWMLSRIPQWYNGMVDTRNRVRQGVSQVEIQLQRRYDLIGRLVETVEGYCQHEQDLQEHVTELRRQAAEGNAGILAEAYPDLKADALFTRLQEELADTEERLALAREYLNEIANFYNTRLQTFPQGPMLRLLGFRPHTTTPGE